MRARTSRSVAMTQLSTYVSSRQRPDGSLHLFERGCRALRTGVTEIQTSNLSGASPCTSFKAVSSHLSARFQLPVHGNMVYSAEYTLARPQDRYASSGHSRHEYRVDKRAVPSIGRATDVRAPKPYV
jgi:hypothetical protein